MRAAASSSASGRWSRRAQSSVTASVLTTLGSSARARVRNSSMPSPTASVGTAYTCSPWSWRRSRLVTRIFGPTMSRTRAISPATSGNRCSALSRRSSARLPDRRSARRSPSARPGCSSTPSAWAREETRSLASLSGANDTHQTPSTYGSDASAAAWSASRLFPVPPGPVSVTRRGSSRCRRSTTSASSGSRPRNGVAGEGRFVSWRLRSGGKTLPPSWYTRSGAARSLKRCSPRSIRSSPSSNAAVDAETRICPPWPAAAIRAAR